MTFFILYSILKFLKDPLSYVKSFLKGNSRETQTLKLSSQSSAATNPSLTSQRFGQIQRGPTRISRNQGLIQMARGRISSVETKRTRDQMSRLYRV